MARMHTRRRGSSGSLRPRRSGTPAWVSLSGAEVTEKVLEMARKGMPASRIGATLRDEHAVPDIREVTGKALGMILTEAGALPKVPDDVASLIRKAVRITDHLSGNPKDIHNRRNLHLCEAKIRRLVRYYNKHGGTNLPPEFNYSLEESRLLIE